jgi:hypothetical protein
MQSSDCYAVVPSRAAAVFHRLPMPVRELLKLCDGSRTVERICAAGTLPATQAQRALERLSAMGVISIGGIERRKRNLTQRGLAWTRGEAPPAPKPLEFSDEEERFFASPIDHLVDDLVLADEPT